METENELEDMYNSIRCDDCGHWHPGNKECDCKDEVEEQVFLCEYCGKERDEYIDCPCLTPMIQSETPERIRFLMSLGHPCEHGEPYSRSLIMDECQRRGKQLLLDLGWPVEPDSIYRNKYTGSSGTLKSLVYNSCMQSAVKDSFEKRLSDDVWSVVEHNWPRDKFDDSEMFDEYKSKLDYFSDKEGVMMEDEDYDEDGYEDEDEGEVSEAPQKRKSVEDKAQSKLGDW